MLVWREPARITDFVLIHVAVSYLTTENYIFIYYIKRKRDIKNCRGQMKVKFRSKLFYSYLLFLIVYSGFVLLPAPSPITLAQYHVSALGLRIIYITIILILAAIWFAGFYGYAKLQAYTLLIKRDKDGKQVAKLTKGIFLLVMWLPVSSVVSAVLNYIAMKHLGLLPAVTIIDNYVNLLFPLLGFIYISRGARGLSQLVRQHPKYRVINLLVVILIYISLIYYRLVATTPNRTAFYHLSIWFILTTLVAPYVYMWSLGLQATYDIYRYRLKVAGLVYRKGWSFLALGLGWLIITSVGFQFLSTLSGRLSHLSIYWLLTIIYSVLLVLSIGFMLIALGTRKLQKIEEV